MHVIWRGFLNYTFMLKLYLIQTTYCRLYLKYYRFSDNFINGFTKYQIIINIFSNTKYIIN